MAHLHLNIACTRDSHVCPLLVHIGKNGGMHACGKRVLAWHGSGTWTALRASVSRCLSGCIASCM